MSSTLIVGSGTERTGQCEHRYPSGQRRLTVNQLGLPFGGSIPSLCTGVVTALVAQLVEHTLGKGVVMGSIPIKGSAAFSRQIIIEAAPVSAS